MKQMLNIHVEENPSAKTVLQKPSEIPAGIFKRGQW
jgi:hypothetical protein